MGPIGRWMVVMEMTLRELLRRRVMLVLLIAVPATFALSSADHEGRAIRFAAIGTAWAASTLGLFSALGSRDVDRRLRVAGHSMSGLTVGRLGSVTVLSGILAGGAAAACIAYFQPDRWPAVLLMFALVALIGPPFGMVCAALVPRELEGALVLMTVTGMQFLMDPVRAAAKLLPFWSTRELATYAVDHTGVTDLRQAVLHAAVYLLGLTVVLVMVQRRRLHRWVRPQPTVGPNPARPV